MLLLLSWMLAAAPAAPAPVKAPASPAPSPADAWMKSREGEAEPGRFKSLRWEIPGLIAWVDTVAINS